MKSIPLGNGMLVLVDDGDFERINQWKWTGCKFGNTFAAARIVYYKKTRTTIYMHRAIINAPDGMSVDHINGNGLDNRRANLRICTHAENMRNRRLQKNNKTGYKGVSLYPEGGYQVKIRINGKLRHIGIFRDVLEAARAYDAAARKHFGKFAKTNF